MFHEIFVFTMKNIQLTILKCSHKLHVFSIFLSYVFFSNSAFYHLSLIQLSEWVDHL